MEGHGLVIGEPASDLAVDRLGRGRRPKARQASVSLDSTSPGTARKNRTVRFLDGRCLGRLCQPVAVARGGKKRRKTARRRGQPWSCLAVLPYLVGRDIYRNAHENGRARRRTLYISIYLTRQQDRQVFWAPNPVFPGTSVVLVVVLAGKTGTLGQDRHAVACRRGLCTGFCMLSWQHALGPAFTLEMAGQAWPPP